METTAHNLDRTGSASPVGGEAAAAGLLPSDFLRFPMGSVLEKSEAETIARNCMVILKRTGNTWRKLTEDDYSIARFADKAAFSEVRDEMHWFRKVVDYTTSPEQAAKFSPAWAAARPA